VSLSKPERSPHFDDSAGEPPDAHASVPLGRHDPYAALRVPNYVIFATGFVLSSCGLQMLGTALSWELYERTRNPLVLGLVGLARALPVIIMALPAGHIIDHADRKRVLALTQTGFALVALLLAYASFAQAPVWGILALVVLAGLVRTFNGPVRSSLLPDLVPHHVFPNAATWNSGVFQISAAVGPVAAGAIIAWAGSAWIVYVVTGALCLSFAILSLFLRPLRHHEMPKDAQRFTGMTDGLRHLTTEPVILSAITLDLFGVLLGGATALLPIYAEDILHVGPVGFGWLRAAPFIGAFVMAMVLAHAPPIRRAGATLLISVGAFGVCTLVFGLSQSFWLSLAALFMLGAVDSVSVVIRHVLVQVRTPARLRGRVSAVNSVFIECSNELGAFESGLVANLFGTASVVTGAVVSAVSGGVGTLIVVAGVALAFPSLRKLDRLQGDKPA
jgi:MFS family permease